MSNQDLSRIINELLNIAVFGKHNFMNLGKDAAIKIFGEENTAVSFISVGKLRIFDQRTRELYKLAGVIISRNYALVSFQRALCELLFNLNSANKQATKEDWINFRNELIQRPDVTIHSLMPIYGIEMSSPKVHLGKFIIYNPAHITNLLKSDYPNNKYLTDDNLSNDNNYRIGLTVNAKDYQKCYDLADQAFTSFEYIANFATAHFHKNSRISIFNHIKIDDVVNLAVTLDKMQSSTKDGSSLKTVVIDDAYYRESNGNEYLWEWITSDERTNLQQKLIDAMEWAGKALTEPDDARALLQYIIAIEATLQFDEGKFIVPSIVSHLSDMVAFLLGDAYEDRLAYAGYIKNLYKQRSALTHSGKGAISDYDLHTAHVLTQKIIRKIISNDQMRTFKTKAELCNYLISLKYGATICDNIVLKAKEN